MNLFPPFFMYFVISASELISGSDVGICTMQQLITEEDDIRANDYFSMIIENVTKLISLILLMISTYGFMGCLDSGASYAII